MQAMLFSPLQLRELRLRNRIVLSPMLTYSATAGYVNDSHLVNYGRHAAGGTGLVFVESTKVDPSGCTTIRDLGLWKDEFVDGMRQLAGVIKSYGAAAGIQLSHGGRKARRALPWEGRGPIDQCPGVDHGEEWELIGPSAIAHSDTFSVPRAMTREDIREVAQAWGRAARRADQAGFDVVEIHGGHGYLIHQFLSATANQRTDEYGGSLQNRMRFAAEVAQEVRRSWPERKPLFFRVSSVDEIDWKIEDSVALAKVLKANGVDVIDCSSGGMTNQSTTDRSAKYGYQVEYARQIRVDAEVMTMAVGLIVHSDQAEDILRAGSADLVALGRELMHNPNWPIDAAQKLGIESPFAQISPVYGFWLEKRARSNFGKPSTWQRGIHSGRDDAA
ncbi:MAG: NADH:flavin oxidoreductase/NADH oxidase [Pseudomonadota bacterium]